MPFQKGNKLATVNKGKIQQRTRDWNDIGAFLLSYGSHKFIEALESQCVNDPERYIETFLKTLEYFRPKLARQDITAEVTHKVASLGFLEKKQNGENN